MNKFMKYTANLTNLEIHGTVTVGEVWTELARGINQKDPKNALTTVEVPPGSYAVVVALTVDFIRTGDGS